MAKQHRQHNTPRRDPVPEVVDDIEALLDDDGSDLVGDVESVETEQEEIPPAHVSVTESSPDAAETSARDPAEEGFLPINTALRNGLPLYVFENATSEGKLAFWKRTRAYANATHRWEETGKWIDFVTGGDISFVPRLWKPRFGG